LSETGSGSDALGARTRATRQADGSFVLNGEKMWITNGGFADIFTIFAKVDGEKFTAFIVEREMGVVSGREEPKLGLDGSSTTALILENVKVPVGNVLGEIGQGHKVAFNILNLGRLKLGTRNIGGAKRALTHAVRYAVERHQFGQPIAGFGLIKQKLAEMAVRCYVGDAMVYRTLGEVDRALAGIDNTESAQVLKAIESFAVECSINKIWTGEALAYVVDESLQVHGGYGYSREFPAERAYRDARITRIYEGTNEINRLIVANRLLRQLPDEAEPDSVRTLLACPSLAGNSESVAEHAGGVRTEHKLLVSARSLIIRALRRAQSRYGDTLSTEQEVLAHIADMAIEVYALESAVLRTEKLLRGKKDPRTAGDVPIDVTRVYASDAADRIEHSARQVEAALREGDEEFLLFEPEPPAARFAYNTVAARRRIADSLIKAGRYYL